MGERLIESLVKTLGRTDVLEEAMSRWAARQGKDRPKLDKELRAVEGQIRKAEAALDRYFNAFESGSMNESTCAARVKKIAADIATLNARRGELADELSEAAPETPRAEQLSELKDELLTALDAGSHAQRKALLQTLVAEIRVKDRSWLLRANISTTVRIGAPGGSRTRPPQIGSAPAAAPAEALELTPPTGSAPCRLHHNPFWPDGVCGAGRGSVLRDGTPCERSPLSTTPPRAARAHASSCSEPRRSYRRRARDPSRACGESLYASRSPCCCRRRAPTARSTAAAVRRPFSRSDGPRSVTTRVRARIADPAKDRSAPDRSGSSTSASRTSARGSARPSPSERALP